jgi:hypothetical protein
LERTCSCSVVVSPFEVSLLLTAGQFMRIRLH